MASGCILGNCCFCGELVWEDEWDEEWFIAHEEFIHEECIKRANVIYRELKMLENRVEQLETMLNKRGN